MATATKYDKLVKKYLKKTGRTKTLVEFKKSLNKRQSDAKTPVKLSFAIQKAPERTKKVSDPVQKRPQKSKNNTEERKALVIPDKFIKIAKKFGLPKEHLEFFYENKDSFHWESKDKNLIHCAIKSCKLTMKPSEGCLLDHMKTIHQYTDIPCDKPDCSYIAFSLKNLNNHKASFHGHGKKESKYAIYPCPYLSCKVSFTHPSLLQRHVNVHQNRVVSCSYCQYRNTDVKCLKSHLNVHFNMKNYVCDLCPLTFTSNDGLNSHKFAVHNTEFTCVDCGKTNSSIKTLKTHRLSCKERLKHSRIL